MSLGSAVALVLLVVLAPAMLWGKPAPPPPRVNFCNCSVSGSSCGTLTLDKCVPPSLARCHRGMFGSCTCDCLNPAPSGNGTCSCNTVRPGVCETKPDDDCFQGHSAKC